VVHTRLCFDLFYAASLERKEGTPGKTRIRSPMVLATQTLICVPKSVIFTVI